MRHKLKGLFAGTLHSNLQPEHYLEEDCVALVTRVENVIMLPPCGYFPQQQLYTQCQLLLNSHKDCRALNDTCPQKMPWGRE